ncbi:hypothetical protein GQ53DRAFT_645846 [Thozetella sp. PMI_491]|nr:hypothetical protein GQ53DRAFT_645846 [Thozetella sp. PMI_491]
MSGTTFQFPPPANPSDPGRGPLIMAIIWTFTPLAALAVGARLYVRKAVTQIITWDDWVMVIALILQIANACLLTEAYRYGMGMHSADLTFDQILNQLKWEWIASAPGILVSVVARISIAGLLVRLFGVHAWFKWFIIIFTGIQTVVSIFLVLVVWLQVSPIDALWDYRVPASHRWDMRIQFYTEYLVQALFTFSDLTYVLFPVVIIWRLNMELRQRLSLIALMTLSLLTMIISIEKTTAFYTDKSPSQDGLYLVSYGVLWGCLEQCFVIVMGCIPPLRAIGKVTAVRGLATSISSLVSGSRKGKQLSSGGYYSDWSKAYDLEATTNKPGGLAHSEYAMRGTSRPSGASSETPASHRTYSADRRWKADQV